jgi:hypothetical protein
MHQTGAFWRYSPWIMARASRVFSLFSEGCGGIGADAEQDGTKLALAGKCSMTFAQGLQAWPQGRYAEPRAKNHYWISVVCHAKI